MLSNIGEFTEDVHTYILVVWVDLALKKVCFLRARSQAPYIGIPSAPLSADWIFCPRRDRALLAGAPENWDAEAINVLSKMCTKRGKHHKRTQKAMYDQRDRGQDLGNKIPIPNIRETWTHATRGEHWAPTRSVVGRRHWRALAGDDDLALVQHGVTLLASNIIHWKKVLVVLF